MTGALEKRDAAGERRPALAPSAGAAAVIVQDTAGERLLREAARGRRTGWILACALILICAVQAASIVILLRTIEGSSAPATAQDRTDLTFVDDRDALIDLLARYVSERESFIPERFLSAYEYVASRSAGAAAQGYQDRLGELRRSAVPGSRLQAHISGSKLEGDNSAFFRVEIVTLQPGGVYLSSAGSVRLTFMLTRQPDGSTEVRVNDYRFEPEPLTGVSDLAHDTEMSIVGGATE
jgi:hypothetical protein